MSRFVPRAQSSIAQGGGPAVDPTWYTYLRSLGIDLDAVESDVASGVSTLAPNGITLLANKPITAGLQAVPHGLSASPDYWRVVKDSARPSMIAVSRSYAATLAIGSTAWTDVACPTTDVDWGSDYAYSAGGPSGTFTAPHAGVYTFNGHAGLATPPAGTRTIGRLSVNSGSVDHYFADYRTGAAATDVRLPISHSMELAAGDTVIVELYQDSVGAISIADCWWSVRSDDSLVIYGADATNIYVGSGRSRTASFWVW